MMKSKKKALGKGLSALLSDNFNTDLQKTFTLKTLNIPIDDIVFNPYQPRSNFEDTSLHELTLSIKTYGIIQPVTVKKIVDGQYQLISGERRLKAAKKAGLTEIPVFIREAENTEMLELALVENIQRQDLNPIEISLCFKRLIEECNITQKELSEKIGKDRTTITNYIRLLKLHPDIQVGLIENKLSMGHARAIINVQDENTQIKIFRKITEKNLNVRQVEELVKNLNHKKNIPTTHSKTVFTYDIEKWKKLFSQKTKSKVSLKLKPEGNGFISIRFNNQSHLMEIIKHFKY